MTTLDQSKQADKGKVQVQSQALTQEQYEKFLRYYMDEHGMRLFLNVKEQPVVTLPVLTEGNVTIAEGVTGDTYPIKHGRVKGWLLRHLVSHFKLKKKPDIGTVLLWMECLAYEHGVDELLKEDRATLAEAIDDDPLFIAVQAHTKDMRVGEEATQRAKDGYEDLRYQAFRLHRNVRNWPSRPSDLSRQLGNMSEALEAILGIEFKVKHTNTGSLWTWKRTKEAEDIGTILPDKKTETQKKPNPQDDLPPEVWSGTQNLTPATPTESKPGKEEVTP